MKELASLHDQHLNRPTLDDSSAQEHAIEITTQEVTQVSAGVDARPPAAPGASAGVREGTCRGAGRSACEGRSPRLGAGRDVLRCCGCC